MGINNDVELLKRVILDPYRNTYEAVRRVLIAKWGYETFWEIQHLAHKQLLQNE